MCDHVWLPIRTILRYNIVCLRCEEHRHVCPRWIRAMSSNSAVLDEARRRKII